MRRLALSVFALFALLFAATPAQAAGPRILAIGDSMMRGVDFYLDLELARIQETSFRTHILIGEGITNEPWVRISRTQARRHRPKATIAFLGANDGYNMVGARCCGAAWVAKYEDRVRSIIRAYSRKGRGEVYWFTLPASESGRRRQIFPIVNDAIRHAVRTSGPHAHVIDAWKVFTPGGVYRRTMSWEGEELEVRNVDGVHLKGGGQRIAAELIRDALLRDGIIAPTPAPANLAADPE